MPPRFACLGMFTQSDTTNGRHQSRRRASCCRRPPNPRSLLQGRFKCRIAYHTGCRGACLGVAPASAVFFVVCNSCRRWPRHRPSCCGRLLTPWTWMQGRRMPHRPRRWLQRCLPRMVACSRMLSCGFHARAAAAAPVCYVAQAQLWLDLNPACLDGATSFTTGDVSRRCAYNR